MRKNLVLLGMMGVGKSTLGKIVAKKLKLKFIDTDMSVEKKCSMKVVDIFQNKGEDFFRTQEEMAVLDSLKEKNCVIALGGGAFLNKKLRDKVLKYSISIWLDVNLKTLNSRIKWNKKRPLLNVKNSIKKIQKLYLERKNIYKLSHYKLNCDNLTKENITKKIINFYETQ
ncbi:shikimate kinase [Pelagibacteraceae bacterium]|mgnify:FL=1|nr:shikimate kinase [Pelagibacteraceae bacterium]